MEIVITASPYLEDLQEIKSNTVVNHAKSREIPIIKWKEKEWTGIN